MQEKDSVEEMVMDQPSYMESTRDGKLLTARVWISRSIYDGSKQFLLRRTSKPTAGKRFHKRNKKKYGEMIARV